jgi:hypothetical protein
VEINNGYFREQKGNFGVYVAPLARLSPGKAICGMVVIILVWALKVSGPTLVGVLVVKQTPT